MQQQRNVREGAEGVLLQGIASAMIQVLADIVSAMIKVLAEILFMHAFRHFLYAPRSHTDTSVGLLKHHTGNMQLLPVTCRGTGSRRPRPPTAVDSGWSRGTGPGLTAGRQTHRALWLSGSRYSGPQSQRNVMTNEHLQVGSRGRRCPACLCDDAPTVRQHVQTSGVQPVVGG